MRIGVIVPPAVQQPVRLLEPEQMLRDGDALDAALASGSDVLLYALAGHRRLLAVWLQMRVAVGEHHHPGGLSGEPGVRLR